MNKHVRRKELLHSIYWIPNLLTTASLLLAFYAIMSAINGSYELAASAVFMSMIFDTLDGRVARLTKSTSSFGAEYDSLADVVSFGVAPALLVYTWSLHSLGRVGWLLAFIHLACTALRLARFNATNDSESDDKKYFQGLPCPAAAAIIVSFVWASVKYNVDSKGIIAWFLAGHTILGAVLMVSNVKFYSFKQITFSKKTTPYVIGFINILVLIMLAIDPPVVSFIVFLGYALSGILMFLYKYTKHTKKV